jgi:hypothetical protein
MLGSGSKFLSAQELPRDCLNSSKYARFLNETRVSIYSAPHAPFSVADRHPF